MPKALFLISAVAATNTATTHIDSQTSSIMTATSAAAFCPGDDASVSSVASLVPHTYRIIRRDLHVAATTLPSSLTNANSAVRDHRSYMPSLGYTTPSTAQPARRSKLRASVASDRASPARALTPFLCTGRDTTRHGELSISKSPSTTSYPIYSEPCAPLTTAISTMLSASPPA
ncbi:hypothetical protein BASA61_003658 [Batrachochytrium salamandrivorans]|nr:hypothetical protein BASA61_003658 [Batrachochytrium salamandrivorans]